MATNELEPPVDPLDEQLTAYLDGELPPEEARALEQRLARDGQVRERLRELAGAWDLLDNLPRTTVDENFAKTTVAMVAVAAKEDLVELQTTAPRHKRQQWLSRAVGVTAALVLGYASFTWFWPDPNQALLANLSLVENWQLYQEADSIDFLNQLDRAGLFWSENTGNPDHLAMLVPPTIKERTSYVNQLSESQRTELRRKQETFDKLEPKEQKQLRDLDMTLQTAPNSARMLEILRNYHNWLNARSPLEIVDVRKLPADQRIDKIRELQLRDEEQWVKQYRFPSHMAEDFRRVYAWLTDLALQHEKEILEHLSEQQRAMIERQPIDSRKRVLLRTWIDQEFAKRRAEGFEHLTEEQRREMKNAPPDRARYLLGQFMRNLPATQRKPMLPVTDAEIDDLLKRLTDNARTILKPFQVPAGASDAERARLNGERNAKIWEWVGDSMRFAFASRGFVSDKEIQDYFAGLSDETKKELALLSPEEWKRELRNRYLGEQGGFGGGWWGGRPWSREGGGRDGGRDDGPRMGPPPDGPPMGPPREGGFKDGGFKNGKGPGGGGPNGNGKGQKGPPGNNPPPPPPPEGGFPGQPPHGFNGPGKEPGKETGSQAPIRDLKPDPTEKNES
jgi:hypothetical protein